MRKIDTPKSSNIEKVLYDDTSKDMTIEFKQGYSYIYKNVPSHIFEAFQTEPSAGKYFHRAIRNNYNYSRVTGSRVSRV